MIASDEINVRRSLDITFAAVIPKLRGPIFLGYIKLIEVNPFEGSTTRPKRLVNNRITYRVDPKAHRTFYH